MTLDLSREHRQRVIEIVERLRLRVDEYLARRIDPSPLLEEARREFRGNAEAGYRITAAASERVLDPLSRARTRGNEDEVGQLAQTAPRRRRAARRLSLDLVGWFRLCAAAFVLFLVVFIFACFGQRFDHQAVAWHEALVIQERDADVRRLAGEYVIGKAQLDRHIRKRDAGNKIRRNQERNHRRQHQVQKVVAIVPGGESDYYQKHDEQQTFDGETCSDGEPKDFETNIPG